jgi:hypothetical protein
MSSIEPLLEEMREFIEFSKLPSSERSELTGSNGRGVFVVFLQRSDGISNWFR